jgi:hypothetical protein
LLVEFHIQRIDEFRFFACNIVIELLVFIGVRAFSVRWCYFPPAQLTVVGYKMSSTMKQIYE